MGMIGGGEAKFGVRHPVIANQIGKYSPGSTNISTDAVRFSTRGNVLQENPSHMGSQVNADRHTLWQATITSTYGSDIAKDTKSREFEFKHLNGAWSNLRFASEIDQKENLVSD
jgi:uncharacterized protein YbdZ (MbtH family)